MEPVNPDQPVDPKPLAELPDPLTPPDCDLRDFSFMPLDVVRLRDSDLAAIEDPEAFRAAVISWCVSWHQVPAASLPDDDAVLCRLLGYGRDIGTWRHVREAGGLHGWIKRNDGRLYHPVVAEKANEAWQRKQKQRRRGAEGARARWNKHPDTIAQASISNGASIPEAMLGDGKGQRQGQGQEASLRSAASISDSETFTLEQPRAAKPKRKQNGFDGRSDIDTDNGFSMFWAAYPRRDGKGSARTAWDKAVAKATPSTIMAGLARYRFSDDPKYRPMPARWLNDERWTSEPPPPAPEQSGFFTRGAI